MKEKRELVPVTSFASLGVGQLVVIKPCKCGAELEQMLVRFYRKGDHDHDGEYMVDAWDTAPMHYCPAGIAEGACVLSAHAVATGVVFLVVDGLDPAADDEQRASDEIRAAILAESLTARRAVGKAKTGRRT